jgi:Bacterial protein of unknown function (HtrL_YibB)
MTTFVTCFINLNEDVARTTLRFAQFAEIAKTGINLCLYVDAHDSMVADILRQYTNVRLMRFIRLRDSLAHRTVFSSRTPIRLPSTDNEEKDTREYMILMNSKIEFIKDAMDQNPFYSSCFAWIDFSIAKILVSREYIDLLRDMGTNVPDHPFLAIPGCWTKEQCSESSILQSICWRYCGGFFWGDKQSLTHFYELYYRYFPIFIAKHHTLMWEVNFWSWLEMNNLWSPQWYLANHDDSIFRVPFHITTRSIFEKSVVHDPYDYPTFSVSMENGSLLGEFLPSSASYIRYDGKHLLNTRFVNYNITDGRFQCHNENDIIMSRNMVTTLDENLRPLGFVIVDDPPKSNGEDVLRMFNGIEDIRLYEKEKKLHYIGTSMSHCECDGEYGTKNWIVSGVYNHVEKKMEVCRTLPSPNNSWCEKNWIPVIVDDEEFFIYQWAPMQIYNAALQHVQTYRIKNSIFAKLRGSTAFTRFGDNLLGLAHFSEGESVQRHYFHVLVLIDGKTLQPLQYSKPFYFCEKPGIEFCTGFAIIDMKYQFWISVRDGSPKHVSVAIDSIPLCNRVSVL